MKVLVLLLSLIWCSQYFPFDNISNIYTDPFSFLKAEKQGCCSWHDGVCGCENGRIVCCDGTLSPSCTC